MPLPRKQLIAADATPYYHCVSRCVRRAFLCGNDRLTGRCFDHRKQWIEDEILRLAQVFAIDVCAYAVMSNHYHVVLHLDEARARNWSAKQVCERWHQLFTGTEFSRRFVRGERLNDVEIKLVERSVQLWRERLASISWFMRRLNEPLAREANREDHCTGKFWEARFKSQALLDEKALAACLAYVDLNPIRAGLATTPESSPHTSIACRIKELRTTATQPTELFPFAGNPREPMPEGLPFRLDDYMALVDWTGRSIRDDKRGSIPQNAPQILERLNIDPTHWITLSTQFESKFKNLVGGTEKIKAAAQKLGFKRCAGISVCRVLLA